MEVNNNENSVKVLPKAPKSSTLRVLKETRRRVLQELAKINKKDYGRKVKFDELLSLALNKVTANDHKALQECSLSNSDRFEKQYKEYATKNGSLSKDEYLGKLMAGELSIPAPRTANGKGDSQP